MSVVHDNSLFPEIEERILTIRGRRHLHERFDPTRTALLVVDMQNAFVAPDAVMGVPAARGVVPNINRLAASLRDAGGKVVWIISTYSAASMDDWASLFRQVMPTKVATGFVNALSQGAEGHELWSELDRREEDLLVEKDRFSAFLQGASDIEPKLRSLGIDTLLVTGTVTQVCCESTARDAQMRNFNVVMISDGNASWSEILHRASLSAWAGTFGDVMTADEAIYRLGAARSAAAE